MGFGSRANENEGIHPAARDAIGVLAEEPMALQVQHLRKRGVLQGVCGAFGQVVSEPTSVTCPRCKRISERRAARRAR